MVSPPHPNGEVDLHPSPISCLPEGLWGAALVPSRLSSDLPRRKRRMTTQFWTADLEVAVNGDELIIKANHLPAIEEQEIEVELDGGEVTVYGHAPGEEHYLHLPLPAGLEGDNVVARLAQSGGLELHMHLPA